MHEDDEFASDASASTWGPALFYVTLAAALVFFWWLVIYDHGIASTHGG